MIQEIKMPAAGQTTNKAVVCRICVKAGDNVKRGDVLLEAETDKAVLPVESFANGTVLAILVAEGDQVTAGTVLMAVGKSGEVYAPASGTAPTAPAPQEVPAQEQEEYLPIVRGEGANLPVPVAPAGAEDPDYPAMPNARRLARERGIDIRRVERHVPQAAAQEPEYEVLPMNRMRQIIGSRMRESLDTIPCWQCTSAIRMDACMDLRDTYREKKGIRLSYNDIMAKAIAVASRKFPLVNARYEDGQVRDWRWPWTARWWCRWCVRSTLRGLNRSLRTIRPRSQRPGTTGCCPRTWVAAASPSPTSVCTMSTSSSPSTTRRRVASWRWAPFR